MNNKPLEYTAVFEITVQVYPNTIREIDRGYDLDKDEFDILVDQATEQAIVKLQDDPSWEHIAIVRRTSKLPNYATLLGFYEKYYKRIKKNENS